jgi:tetratricopeptide (TPR) repeat protein
VAPGTAGCDYALALALGVEARAHPTGALQRLPEMVRLLRSADRQEPGLDAAGPSRVLALLLLRAPGWPLGPGDPEAALEAARRAAELAPDHAPNQLALAEALRANGEDAGAVGAARRAVELAKAAARAGDPEAPAWLRDGERLLAAWSR